MKTNAEVLILGGGLAGLTAAIHLAGVGMKVIVLEKNSYPRHKVCGEYISNEVLPYLESLGIQVEDLHPTHIQRTSISTAAGRSISANLPLGGFGISRYKLDELLYQIALSSGCTVEFATVENVIFSDDIFTVITDGKTYAAPVALGAFGKRSAIDVKLNRSFISRKSHWLAVKMHYRGSFASDLVALHNFKGGYCGVSKVEGGLINICWLADYQSFKKYKSIEEFQRVVLSANPELAGLFNDLTPVFEKPLVISQISFEPKLAVENHILMIGDTAGLIHPLCGNGMAMAIHSARIACENIIAYQNGTADRSEMEACYKKQWKAAFSSRIFVGRILAALMRNAVLAPALMWAVIWMPSLLGHIIKRTHGKPLTNPLTNA